MHFNSGHTRHPDIGYQKGCFADLRGLQVRFCRGKQTCLPSQRANETRRRETHGFVVVDDTNDLSGMHAKAPAFKLMLKHASERARLI